MLEPVLLPLGVEELEPEPDLLGCCRLSAVCRTFKVTRSKIMSFKLKTKHIKNTANNTLWRKLTPIPTVLVLFGENIQQTCTIYLTNT